MSQSMYIAAIPAMANQSDNGSFFLSEELYKYMISTKVGESVKFATWNKKASNIFSSLSLGFSILGIIGNALCTEVMGKVQKTVKGVRLIKYLAIVDTLVLILVAINHLVYLIPDIEAIFECIMFLFAPMYGTLYMLETNLTVLIAVQRCLALTIPFMFKRVMRTSVVNKLLTGIAVYTVIFNIPEWIDAKPVFYWSENLKMTMIRSGDYNDILSEEFIFSWTVFRMIFCHIVPLFILVVCNIILIVSRRRMTMTGQTGQRMGANQLTAIIIAIIALSVVVHCMFITLFTFAKFKNFHVILEEATSYTYLTTLFTLFYLRNLVLCVNSSTNFIFYCTFGREFRRKLMDMFRRATPNQQPQQNAIEMREVHVPGRV